MLNISLELSSIPKNLIFKHENGKSYINITISEMKEPDKFGKTHTVFISQSKEEREAKKEKIYIGKGKEIVFGNNSKSTETKKESVSEPYEDCDDSLPF